jgi:hypothetical protein
MFPTTGLVDVIGGYISFYTGYKGMRFLVGREHQDAGVGFSCAVQLMQKLLALTD